MFYCIKPTNLHIILRVAYLDFIKFEKSSMIYLPLLENRKKIKLKKITDEKIVLLHILIGYDFYGIEQSSKCHLFIVLLWIFFFPTSLFYTQSFTKNCAKIRKREFPVKWKYEFSKCLIKLI